MYVHIGKDTVINSDHILAIFDVKTLEKKNSLENICKNLKISDKIVDVSEENKKSFILIEKSKETRGYISNISSITIKKRMSNKVAMSTFR